MAASDTLKSKIFVVHPLPIVMWGKTVSSVLGSSASRVGGAGAFCASARLVAKAKTTAKVMNLPGFILDTSFAECGWQRSRMPYRFRLGFLF